MIHEKVIDMLTPNSKEVYRVKYEYTDANGVVKTKWSTMFPNNKSEISTAKAVESLFNNNPLFN